LPGKWHSSFEDQSQQKKLTSSDHENMLSHTLTLTEVELKPFKQCCRGGPGEVRRGS
jgi:hypothetical protein